MDILFIAKMIGYTLQFDWKLIFSQASFCSFNRCSDLKIFLRLLTHKKHHFYKHHAIYFRANQAKTTATMKRLHNCCTINKEVKWNLKIKKMEIGLTKKKKSDTKCLQRKFPQHDDVFELYFYLFLFSMKISKYLLNSIYWRPLNAKPLTLEPSKIPENIRPFSLRFVKYGTFFTTYFCLILSALSGFKKIISCSNLSD